MRIVAGLRDHGERLAVVTGTGRLSYRQLADRVDRAAGRLGATRRLVLLEAANDLDTLVDYLGALRAGHVVLMAPRADAEQCRSLVARWDPDVVVSGSSVQVRRAGSAHDLHPDLALLLSTSGSTGSPRLVRLAAASLDANAAAIGEYLGIRPDDRAVTTLPLHYCYGLSVVHSNLLAGAALVLTDRSVTDPGFWALVREHRATALHAVPHTLELLDRVGFADMTLPHLRYLTQAGGRLAPDQVRRWAGIGRARGWSLVVMYGQTEATARMAYLPPELAATAPTAIGRPIPGGSLRVEPIPAGPAGPDIAEDIAEEVDEDVGELVYSGPNVMLGYAHTPGDLALGRTVHELRTGDLGRRRPDGLFEVVGRAGRFVKPVGVRVDLDALETTLADHGWTTAVTGSDTEILVAVAGTSAADVARVRETLLGRLPLPPGVVAVVAVPELPRRPNGKLDHPAVAELVRAARVADAPPGVTPRARAIDRWRRRRGTSTSVREIFARTFPGHELRDEATFVDLGGDSLTYVQVSVDLERALGGLPEHWDTVPLGRLEQLHAAGSSAGAPAAPRRWATLETVVVLRAAAIVLVVAEHVHLWSVLGGAHLLLAIAGWTFARFVLAERRGEGPGDRWTLVRRILRSTALIAVPSSLWIAFRATTQADVHYADALLAGSILHPLVQGYWFVDVLVQTLLVAAALFAVPAVRRLERRHPYAVPVGLLAVAQLARLLPERADAFAPDLYSTHLVAWLFVLGWLIHRTRTRTQAWVTAALVLALVPPFFGTQVERAAIVAGGLLLLLFVPRVSLPRRPAAVLSTIASASLGIYLTHFALLPLQFHGVRPALLLPAGIVVGIASWWLVTAALRRLVTEWRTRRLAGRGPADADAADHAPDGARRDELVAAGSAT